MNTFKKAVNWYKSVNKLWFTIITSTALLVLSTFWNPLIYVLLVYIAFNIVFMDYGQAIALNLYFLAFTGFLVLYVGVPLVTFEIFIVKYIIDIVKKRKKLYLLPLLTTAAIALVFGAIHYEINDYGALQGVLIIGVLFMIYLAFAFREDINCHDWFRALIYGLIASAVLGGILYFIPAAKMYAWTDWVYGSVSIRDRFVFAASQSYTRFEFLCFHPNHLYCLAIVGISYIVYWFLQKTPKSKRDIAINIAELAVLSVIGFMTMSKGFLIMFVLVAAYAFVMLIVTYKRKALLFVLPVVAVMAIAVGVFHEFFLTLLRRFLGNGDGDIWAAITTGRTDIWKQFLEEQFSSPLKIIFGVGLLSKDAVDIGPHSLYIALLYRFGIVGLAALGFLAYSYVRCGKIKLKFSITKIFPFAVFMVVSLQECTMDERLFLFLATLCFAFGKDRQPALAEAADDAQGATQDESMGNAATDNEPQNGGTEGQNEATNNVSQDVAANEPQEATTNIEPQDVAGNEMQNGTIDNEPPNGTQNVATERPNGEKKDSE